MVAVGRFAPDGDSPWCEVALTVHDELQNRGIGNYLMGRLIEIARSKDIPGFVGYVLSGNSRMLAIFEKSGLPVESALEHGTYTVRLRLVPAT
jgi:GNAT superfamily N-acetyltransferase